MMPNAFAVKKRQKVILRLRKSSKFCFCSQLSQHPLEVDFSDQQKEDEERLLVEREEKARDEDAR